MAKLSSTHVYGNLTVDGNIKGNIVFKDASTTEKGVVQLSDSLNSTSVTTAATSSAVKKLEDTKSNTGHTHASIQKLYENAEITGSENLPYAGLTFGAVHGPSITEAFPERFGNSINIKGTGENQLFLGWNPNSTSGEGKHAGFYFRNKRDLAGTRWSEWERVFSENNKPSWNDISNKPTEFEPGSHIHNDIYYTEAEVDEKNAQLDARLSEIEGKMATSIKIDITENDWNGTGLMSCIISHNLNIAIENIEVKFYTVDQAAVSLDYEYLDPNRIRIYSDEACPLISIISGLSITADNTGLAEVKDARENYFGKEFSTIKERLDYEFDFGVAQGLRGAFVEQSFESKKKIENTIDGKVKNIELKGNTIGGYDSIAKEPREIQSVAGSSTEYLSGSFIRTDNKYVTKALESLTIFGESKGGYNKDTQKVEPLYSSCDGGIYNINSTGKIVLEERVSEMKQLEELLVFGKTKGGYNSSTNTAVPLQSIAEDENLMVVKNNKNLMPISSKRLENINVNSGGEPANIVCTNIPVESGKTYIASYVGTKSDNMQNIMLCRYFHENITTSKNHTELWKEIGKDAGELKFTVPEGINYISYTFGNCYYDKTSGVPGWLQLEKLQLEEIESNANSATSYFQQSTETIDVELPFNGGFKSVRDYSDEWKIKAGKIIQRVDSKTLSGAPDESWSIKKQTSDKISFEHPISNLKKFSEKPSVICSNHPSGTNLQVFNAETLGISNSTERPALFLCVNISDLESADLVGLKKYLQANPITIQYILETPIEHTVAKKSLNLGEKEIIIRAANKIKTASMTCFSKYYPLRADHNQEHNHSKIRMIGNNLAKDFNYDIKYDAVENDGKVEKEISAKNHFKGRILENLKSWYYIDLGYTFKVLEPNTTYTIFFEKAVGANSIVISDHTTRHTYSNTVIIENNKAVITTTADFDSSVKNIFWLLPKGTAGSEIEIQNMFVIKGNHSSYEYKNYIEQNHGMNIPFENGLSRVGAFADSYDPILGEFTRRTVTKTFKGLNDEYWTMRKVFNNTISFSISVKSQLGFLWHHKDNVMCSHFLEDDTYSEGKEHDHQCFRIDNDGTLFFRVDKANLETLNEQGFRNWLYKNPVTVIYPREKPVKYSVTPAKLNIFDYESTAICSLSKLQGSVSAIVSSKAKGSDGSFENDIVSVYSNNANLNTLYPPSAYDFQYQEENEWKQKAYGIFRENIKSNTQYTMFIKITEFEGTPEIFLTATGASSHVNATFTVTERKIYKLNITTPADFDYKKSNLRLPLDKITNGARASFEWIVLIEGDVAESITEYEPSYNSKSQTKLPFSYGLKKLSDTVYDYIQDTDAGKVEIVQKVGRRLFKGDPEEDWRDTFGSSNNYIRFTIVIPEAKRGLSNCNNFERRGAFPPDDIEGHTIDAHENILYLNFPKSKLKIHASEGLRDYLREHPLEVLFELAEPIIHELDVKNKDFRFKTYDDRTHFSSTNTVSPTAIFNAPLLQSKSAKELEIQNELLSEKIKLLETELSNATKKKTTRKKKETKTK